MAIEVFNRYENKYLINSSIYKNLRQRLSDYMELDDYNKQRETYMICNIYYDTDDDHLIRTSIKKPGYREKLRLRSYGTPDSGSEVYLEIKKKVCGLGNKRRSALRPCEAYSFLDTAVLPDIQPYMNRQVLCEIQYILKSHTLKPKVYLAYERRAYFVKGKHDLRISFDTSITTRRTDLQLESGFYGKSLLRPDQWIMEVKTAQNMPIWLTRLLSEYKIYPVSFSKYGVEYKTTLIQNMPEENTICVPAPVHSGVLLPA